MRLTSWNLLHGLAIPPADPANIGQNQALLESSLVQLGADVLGLQEVDFHLERSGQANQVGEIAALLGAVDWAFAPSVMGSPDEKWRGTNSSDIKVVTSEMDSASPGYGIGLVSKIPVISWHRLDLQRSPVGILMSVNRKSKRVYVRDHPRSALAAVLENGWLIVNTHLSFVPVVNLLQLLKIKRWVKKLPVTDKAKIIVMGDLNLPFGFLVKSINWNSLAKQKTFPSWNPQVQIDYILSQKVASEDVVHAPSTYGGISDHLPLIVDLETN
jgi:endonuclease/exonuclease/phosphatase family metal-dependent hydrolase